MGVGVAASSGGIFRRAGAQRHAVRAATDQYRVFSGVAPLGTGPGMGFEPHTALLHADANTPTWPRLVMELAGTHRHGYLFGGLASSRSDVLQFAVGGNGNIRGQGAPAACSAAAWRRGLRRRAWRWCRASRRAACRWRRCAK